MALLLQLSVGCSENEGCTSAENENLVAVRRARVNLGYDCLRTLGFVPDGLSQEVVE